MKALKIELLLLFFDIIFGLQLNQGFFKRTLTLDELNDINFLEDDEYPGGASSVIECAEFTLAKQYETGLNPYINAFVLDKGNDQCKSGSIPYSELKDLMQWPAAITEDKSGVYLMQGCYVGTMPYTDLEADPALQLYYRGPNQDLKRFDTAGSITVLQDPANWVKGKEFIWPGRFSLEASASGKNYKVTFSPSFFITDFSISIWYYGYSHALALSRPRALFVLYRDHVKTNNEEISLATRDEDNALVLVHRKGPTNTYFEVGTTQNQKTLIPTEEWVHLVVTYDAVSAKVRFYKDGILTNDETVSPAVSGITLGFIRFGGDLNVCECSIDEFELYNRVLDQQEAQKLYLRFAKDGPCVN